MKQEECSPGVEALVQGTPLHHGHVVTIVDPKGRGAKSTVRSKKNGP